MRSHPRNRVISCPVPSSLCSFAVVLLCSLITTGVLCGSGQIRLGEYVDSDDEGLWRSVACLVTAFEWSASARAKDDRHMMVTVYLVLMCRFLRRLFIVNPVQFIYRGSIHPVVIVSGGHS